jgi:hypothetical protein
MGFSLSRSRRTGWCGRASQCRNSPPHRDTPSRLEGVLRSLGAWRGLIARCMGLIIRMILAGPTRLELATSGVTGPRRLLSHLYLKT